ncbi:MAG TPA: hypothetical protein VD963_02750 [Phycisphaerales bacterium]|nr:hypothetical protein [Phycisphaerales bacterium]
MSTHELLELAALDALGLLDEHEREDFDAAFAAAAPALQAQVRREQARFAATEGLLPEIEAPASLRARVIAAVREAVEAMALSRQARRGLRLAPARGVSPMWRAGAVGALAATLVFALTTLQMRSNFREVERLMAGGIEESGWIRDFGPRFQQMLFDPATRVVQFTPAAADAAAPGRVPAGAVLLVNPENRSGQIYIRDLPTDAGEFALVLLDESGQVVGDALLRFRPTGAMVSERLQNVALETAFRLAIIPGESAEAAPILRSASRL